MKAEDDKPAGIGTNAGQRGPLRPRDAATLVIVDTARNEPRVLMGRRRADQVFLPGKYVFPGGRVDRGDGAVEAAHELKDGEIAKLLMDMKGRASVTRARALALAAVRETFEEAGLLIGAPASGPVAVAGTSWQRFCATGLKPHLAPLTYFARAITPPGRPRRYDTRFFCVEASAIAHRTAPLDEELSTLDWFSLDEARALDLPSITRAVIEDLADRIVAGPLGAADVPVPFYYFRNGTFQRILLGHSATADDLDR